MTSPMVPQRPNRTQKTVSELADMSAVPTVPPRPSRSRSSNREFATRSPLNDPPFKAPSDMSALSSNGYGAIPEEVLRRPSVASLPLIGQEGQEYASLDHVHQLKDNDEQRPGTPGDTRQVAGDLPLHAPKASAPSNSTRSGVPAVVRTSTSTAAEAGVGRDRAEYDDSDMSLHRVSTRSREFRPASSGLSRQLTRSTSRPASAFLEEDEQGIPHIGQNVPMMPNAGDVQAPSPGPYASFAMHADGSRPGTREGRLRSAAGFHGPPGSYGLHGHGLVPQDQFEKAWYEKHPEELLKEEKGAHGPNAAIPRAEWALSSEELNKLVQENVEKGFGTSERVISVPTEAIGYKASAEYSSKTHSPSLHPVISRPLSQIHTESPLRTVASNEDDVNNDKLHLDPPPHRGDKYTGGGYDPPTADLGPEGGNTAEKGGYIDELGRGIPILASDEIQKRPGSEYLHPAVSPEALKHGDGEYFSENEDHLPAWQRRKASGSGRLGRRPNSRPSSRPSSIRLHHEIESTGTPLNEIEEYEPLFKDEDELESTRPRTAADKLKRPNLEAQRFPSQDIWEDTPNSLQLHTIVGSPQEPEEVNAAKARFTAASHFETPEQEQKRRGEITEEERPSFLENRIQGFAKPKFNAGIRDEVSRPGMGRRFPSQDIWEDTPDSLRLETTIGRDESKLRDPSGGAVPATNALSQGFVAVDRSLRSPVEEPVVPARPALSSASEQPGIPPRPSAKNKEVPSIPERPKPSVPPRPARASNDQGGEGEVLNKTSSNGSAGSIEAASIPAQLSAKSKPQVPSRPAQGSKIASLKAGFMNDLNSRLQLGPQAKKAVTQPDSQPEEQEEKAPLSDARKGRARGPARRGPAAASASTTEASAAGWAFSSPVSLWHISHVGLNVHSTTKPASLIKSAPIELDEAPSASPLSTNTAGETLQPPSEVPKTMRGELAHDKDLAMDARARKEDEISAASVLEHEKNRIGSEGDMPEPISKSAEQTTLTSETGVQTGEVQMSSTLVGVEGKGETMTAFVDGGKTEGSTILVNHGGDTPDVASEQ